MALTITERLRWTEGGKAFRAYRIVHDGSILSISAGSMDMDYIEAITGQVTYVSMQANTSVPLDMTHLSINASNSGVTWDDADANAVTQLTVAGW